MDADEGRASGLTSEFAIRCGGTDPSKGLTLTVFMASIESTNDRLWVVSDRLPARLWRGRRGVDPNLARRLNKGFAPRFDFAGLRGGSTRHEMPLL